MAIELKRFRMEEVRTALEYADNMRREGREVFLEVIGEEIIVKEREVY